jgi:hypothetical protein
MESILEMRFHHIVERLLHTWGSPAEFNEMFSDLVFDTRSDRTGWPMEAWDELQFLQKLHKHAYENKAKEHMEELDDRVKWV